MKTKYCVYTTKCIQRSPSKEMHKTILESKGRNSMVRRNGKMNINIFTSKMA